MISTPSSLISPTTVQTFEVPISRPATMLCFLAIVSVLNLPPSPKIVLRAQSRHNLIAKAHIERSEPLLVPLPQCKHAVHALDFVLPVAPAHAQRDRLPADV